MRSYFDRRVPMRDGVELSADVYLPEGTDPASAVVTISPYNKNSEWPLIKARAFTAAGFAFVWADVRGRGDSDGRFAPYRNDGPDGHDVVEWVAAQGWCSGAVGLWGRSYSGYNQWLIALERPPHLRALAPYVAPPGPFAEWPTGTRVPLELPWYRYVHGRVVQNLDGVDWPAIYEHLPLETMDQAAGFDCPEWSEDLAHPLRSEYWDPISYQDRIATVEVPALGISGWYDADQIGTVVNFERASRETAVGANHRLVMGPWDHLLTRAPGSFAANLSDDPPSRSATRIGPVEFGPSADLDLEALELRWFGHWLRGEDNGVGEDPPVSVFVMGENRWRSASSWPLAETEWTPFYLHSGGGANSRHGDGQLQLEAPSGSPLADTYRADPLDPVPFISSDLFIEFGGPDDYAEVEEREDVLVYTSPVLEQPLEVAGPIAVHAFVSSDRPDTDFMAKLLDVHPSGCSQRLTDGMIRMRFREGFDAERLLEPGRVYDVEIDAWTVAHVFAAGHRVRLEIASAAFPKFDRNLNNGEPLATSVRPEIARNSVWHGAGRASHLLLPVIPAAAPTAEPETGAWPRLRADRPA